MSAKLSHLASEQGEPNDPATAYRVANHFDYSHCTVDIVRSGRRRA